MFDELLIHEVEVLRRSGATDRFGQPADSNPTKLASLGTTVGTYPCRVVRGRRGRTNEERNLDVFADQLEIFTAFDADVEENDGVRVSDPVTGEVLVPLAMVKLKNLVYDSSGPHHLELHAQVQRGPQ